MDEHLPESPYKHTVNQISVPADTTALLLEFVRDRDIDCPRCGYNLRNLTRPICPECGHLLHLKVGSTRVHFAVFLLTVAPGMFSGVAAALFSGAAFYSLLYRGRLNNPPTPIRFAVVFGWISAVATLVLYRFREKILRFPTSKQWVWAVSIWLIHILAFAIFAFFMS